MTTVHTQPRKRHTHHRVVGKRQFLLSGLGIALFVLGGVILLNLMLGAADIPARTVRDALFNYDPSSFDHLIIRTVRLPRILAGVLAGGSLAVAGAMMQGLTRNPLASPGILGINAGAAFAVVLAVYMAGSLPLSSYAMFAMLGATLAAVFVYGLGSLGRGGATPLRLTLAGVILTAFLSSFTTAILITDQNTLDQVRFWTVGSLAGRDWAILQQTSPYMLVGLVGSVLLARQLTTISLGEDVALGLGQNTTIIKALSAFIVILLAGGAVALAGPIGFVGLVAPHFVRFFVGVDYRWILPYCIITGALLVLGGDLVARMAIRPQELPVGAMMALVGAPFFVGLARWKV